VTAHTVRVCDGAGGTKVVWVVAPPISYIYSLGDQNVNQVSVVGVGER